MNLTNRAIARIAYEAVRAFFAGQGVPLVEWERLSAEQQGNSENGVSYLALNGIATTTAKLMHTEFCHYMTARGWKYGRDTDPEAKTNSNLCPWHQLPEVGKRGFAIFRGAAVGCLAPLSI